MHKAVLFHEIHDGPPFIRFDVSGPPQVGAGFARVAEIISEKIVDIDGGDVDQIGVLHITEFLFDVDMGIILDCFAAPGNSLFDGHAPVRYKIEARDFFYVFSGPFHDVWQIFEVLMVDG